MNDVRIADVFFLSGNGQNQMVAHQPCDQAGLVSAEALFQAEGFGVDGAQFRMIAAAALGDIVK